LGVLAFFGGLKIQQGNVYFDYFSRDQCSVFSQSFEQSRRELSIDVAEHRTILKNYQYNT